MENNLLKPTRWLLAIPMIVFGVQHFIYKNFLPKLEPVPAWVPARVVLAYVTGTIIILAAVGIVSGILDRQSAIVLGIIFIGSVIFLHLPLLVSNLHDPDKWACICEELGIGSGVIMFAGLISGKHSNGVQEKPARVAGIFFALSLVIFGIQHFMYGEYIAKLIPSWIPGHIFLAYFIGVAFIAVALSILIKKKTWLAGILLGFMFLFWEISLHIPRVIAKPNGMDEWTSAAVALAMCASSFVVALSAPGEQVTAHALQRQNY